MLWACVTSAYAGDVCPPEVLSHYIGSHERDLWNLVHTDRALQRDLRRELENLETRLRDKPPRAEAEVLEYRASVILTDLSTLEKRLPAAIENHQLELKQSGEELERLMWEYLREEVPHSPFDILKIARKVLDLRGVEYRTLTHEDGHLGLEILQGREQTPNWVTRIVKRVGRTDRETKVYFVPSKLRKKTAIAMMNADRSALYVDVETLVRGNVSPTALHEVDHFFSRKSQRGILASSLEDAGGRFAHDEPRAYSVEAVARYLDIRRRLREFEVHPPKFPEAAAQELRPIWQEYISRFKFGAQHARRSLEILRRLEKQDAAQWILNLQANSAKEGTFLLSIRDAKGWVHTFPTRQTESQAALQEVRAQWAAEIQWNEAMARAFDEVLNQKTSPDPVTLTDYAEKLASSEEQMNRLWAISRRWQVY